VQGLVARDEPPAVRSRSGVDHLVGWIAAKTLVSK